MPSVRATIVQISDLHLNMSSGKAIQAMVQSIVGQEKPDVMIVSGDLANQPLPWQMKRAARFIEGLRKVCPETMQLMVIAGNHDFKFWGNVGLFRLTRIPFEIYFRRGGLTHGIWWRFFQSIGLGLHALWPWSKRMREPLQFLDFADLGITLVGLNSNTLSEMMAAGRVEPDDLQDLFAKYDRFNQAPAFGSRFKIAVVHHHPAPIADVATNLAARVEESFMVFYNAGSFLREINRRGFNLVLHGHKHFAGFLRIASDFGDRGRAEVSVAAAGSACHNHPDDPRGHHMHVIRLYDDDTATLKSLFFSANVQSTESTRTYRLDRPNDVQRRRYDAFRGLQGLTVREIRKISTITNDGYTGIEVGLDRCRIHSEAGLENHALDYQASEPAYLRGFTKVERDQSPKFLKLVCKKSELRAFSGSIEFGRRYTPQDAPFDFGFCFRLINGHTLTPREFQRHYAGKSQEWEETSLFCYLACEVLTLEAHFPEGYKLNERKVEPCVEYVPAPLKGVRDQDFDWNVLKSHDEESARARESLQILPTLLRLTVHNPIPGFLYKIRWVPSDQSLQSDTTAPRITLQTEQRVDQVQKKLLATARASATSNAVPGYDSSVTELNLLAENIAGVSRLQAGDALHVSAMIFHQDDAKLYTVCANYGKIGELLKETFVSGEGCAGFVFEKVRPILYHSSRDTIGYFIRPEERPGSAAGMLNPAVLLCFPWVEAGIVLGVVNVSTRQEDSGLLSLFDLEEQESETAIGLLQELVRRTTSKLFTMVSESRHAANLG